LIRKLDSTLAVTTQKLVLTNAALESMAPGVAAAAAARNVQENGTASEHPLRVAITLMTRAPHRFDWWLRYHRALGICHVFVHVEATPELLPLLTSGEFADFVTVTSTSSGVDGGKGDGTSSEAADDGGSGGSGGSGGGAGSQGAEGEPLRNNYHTLMQRQERQVRSSMQQARAMGIDWLFHIDDDELLHLEVPFAELVRELEPTAACLVLVNAEAVPSGELSPKCVFTSTSAFTLHRMQAYRNGKAAGRLQAAGTGWMGPHRFAGVQHVVPATQACLLHFESATYDMWKGKFLRHSRGTQGAQFADIPFELYRESIRLFQTDPSGGEDEARWKAFYHEHKVSHFAGLADNQKRRIRLSSTDVPRMI
jgi:hypothetical protein